MQVGGIQSEMCLERQQKHSVADMGNDFLSQSTSAVTIRSMMSDSLHLPSISCLLRGGRDSHGGYGVSCLALFLRLTFRADALE